MENDCRLCEDLNYWKNAYRSNEPQQVYKRMGY